jgi:flagellar hook protein FlgE
MLRSLNAGVSGLKGFQTKLDVIGNNIANVNTVGFKKGRVVFEDIFSQTVKAATGPTATSGGTNPIQVGLGSRVGSIDTLHTPGSPTTTNFSLLRMRLGSNF